MLGYLVMVLLISAIAPDNRPIGDAFLYYDVTTDRGVVPDDGIATEDASARIDDDVIQKGRVAFLPN